jgi:D-glycero-alpha-D-manno-heptose 1-phosphate guanylyltransferase
MMEAIVLAGGLGTRLSSVLPGTPKGMAPVGGRPFLELLLSMLKERSIDRIIFSLGYKAEVIENHFGDSFHGMKLVYTIEKFPLGTGGATRAALRLASSHSVFVVNGDTLVELNYEAMYKAHQTAGSELSIAVSRVEDTARYGRVVLAAGHVTSFAEKKQAGPGVINTGVYLLEKGIFDAYDLPEAFSIESGFFALNLPTLNPLAYETNGYFIDIGVPEDLNRAQKELI